MMQKPSWLHAALHWQLHLNKCKHRGSEAKIQFSSSALPPGPALHCPMSSGRGSAEPANFRTLPLKHGTEGENDDRRSALAACHGPLTTRTRRQASGQVCTGRALCEATPKCGGRLRHPSDRHHAVSRTCPTSGARLVAHMLDWSLPDRKRNGTLVFLADWAQGGPDCPRKIVFCLKTKPPASRAKPVFESVVAHNGEQSKSI